MPEIQNNIENMAQYIEHKLTNELSPTHIEVKDESHLHAGHAGAREGGQSHFRVFIVSHAFDGLSRVARQRLVNQLLAEELKQQIHALALKTITPQEHEPSHS